MYLLKRLLGSVISDVITISGLGRYQLTHPPLDKMAIISQVIISDAILSMDFFLFWWKFHWSLFLKVQLIISQHCLDNGMVPNRWQANIWTNADPVHWRIFAALGGGGLTIETWTIPLTFNGKYLESNYVDKKVCYFYYLYFDCYEDCFWGCYSSMI